MARQPQARCARQSAFILALVMAATLMPALVACDLNRASPSREAGLMVLPTKESPKGEIVFADDVSVHWARCAGENLKPLEGVSLPEHIAQRCQAAEHVGVPRATLLGRFTTMWNLWKATSSDEEIAGAQELLFRILRMEGVILAQGHDGLIDSAVREQTISENVAAQLRKGLKAPWKPLFVDSSWNWSQGCPRETRLTRTYAKGCFLIPKKTTLRFSGVKTTDFLTARKTCGSLDNGQYQLPSPNVIAQIARDPGLMSAVSDDQMMFVWTEFGAAYELVNAMEVGTPPKNGALVVCDLLIDRLLPNSPQTVASGAEHSCGLTPEGKALCWGGSSDGQLENIPSIPLTTIVAGRYFTCGLTTEGKTVCWGKEAKRVSPQPDIKFKSLVAGEWSVCGITPEDRTVCWNDEGLMGGIPNEPLTNLSSSFDYWCGLSRRGQIRCWGTSEEINASPPREPMKALSIGFMRGFGLDLQGMPVWWGKEYHWSEAPPVQTPMTMLAGRHLYTCGLGLEGFAHCWDFQHDSHLSPPSIPFTMIAVSEKIACGLTSAGVAKCWGDRLMAPDWTGGKAAAVAKWFSDITPDVALKTIWAGENYMCGLTVEGRVLCWGDGREHQLDGIPKTRLYVSSAYDRNGKPVVTSPKATCQPPLSAGTDGVCRPYYLCDQATEYLGTDNACHPRQ